MLGQGSAYRGFSLLELMLAMVIVAVATTSLLAWTAALKQMSYVESLGAAAIALCQFKMEEIKNVRFDQLKPENFPPEARLTLDTRGTATTQDDLYVARAVIITDIGNGDVPLKEVTVRCTFSVGGHDYTEELVTWVSIAG